MGITHTIRLARLTSLRKKLGDEGAEDILHDIGMEITDAMRKNILGGGKASWARWKQFKPNTAVKRAHEGKDSRPMSGIAHQIRYYTQRASLKIAIESPWAKLHDWGPNRKSWMIPTVPKTKGWIAFPTVKGWVFSKQIKHKGFPQRVLMMPIEDQKEIALKHFAAHMRKEKA